MMLRRSVQPVAVGATFNRMLAVPNRIFSTDSQRHKTKHIHANSHPKFFEDDFISTSIRELEFVRSPFYDLAKSQHLEEGEEAQEFLSNVQVKIGMTSFLQTAIKSQHPNKESVAFTRYADRIKDDSIKEKLQFPRGEPFRRIDPAKELFKVQKTNEHWEQVARSKAFLADDFFPPRALPLETNLQQLLS